MVIGSPGPGSMTGAPDRSGAAVVVLGAAALDPDGGRPARATALADLARDRDLVVVYGLGADGGDMLGAHTLVRRLRALLPRHSIVAVLVDDHPGAVQQEFATIAGLIEDGSVAVAIAVDADPLGTASALADHLGADPVVRLEGDGQLRTATG